MFRFKAKGQLAQRFLAPGYTPDTIEVVGDMAYVLCALCYVLCATKYSDLKINNNFIARKLKTSATTRVYNTIRKIMELGEQ